MKRQDANMMKLVRLTLCLTMQELADRAGVTVGTIVSVEHGGFTRLQWRRHASKIARALGITEEDLTRPFTFGTLESLREHGIIGPESRDGA